MRSSPPSTLQVSDCSTFRIMCDIPPIAVCHSPAIECFPGMAPKFCFKYFVAVPVAPVIPSANVHFMLHIRCVTNINPCVYFLYASVPPFRYTFSLSVFRHSTSDINITQLQTKKKYSDSETATISFMMA